MVISVIPRILPFLMGLLCLLPVGVTIYTLFEMAVANDWGLKFAPAQVDHLPLALHGVGMSLFLVIGLFQMNTRLRMRRPELHRKLGRIAGMGAILGGITGIWMTLLHLEISTPLLVGARLIIGTAMTLFVILAIRDAKARRIQSHRAWMLRAYAFAFTSATLSIIFLPAILIFGEPSPLLSDFVQIMGWVINLAIAEIYLRHKGRKSPLKGATA